MYMTKTKKRYINRNVLGLIYTVNVADMAGEFIVKNLCIQALKTHHPGNLKA